MRWSNNANPCLNTMNVGMTAEQTFFVAILELCWTSDLYGFGSFLSISQPYHFSSVDMSQDHDWS